MDTFIVKIEEELESIHMQLLQIADLCYEKHLGLTGKKVQTAANRINSAVAELKEYKSLDVLQNCGFHGDDSLPCDCDLA